MTFKKSNKGSAIKHKGLKVLLLYKKKTQYSPGLKNQYFWAFDPGLVKCDQIAIKFVTIDVYWSVKK